MSNMADCLQRAIDFGELDKARGIATQAQYKQLVDRYSTIMGLPQAQARAAADLKEAVAKLTRARFHKTVNQLQAMRRINHLVQTAPDPAAAVRNLIEYSEGSGFRGESVRSLAEAYEASITAGLKDALDKIGTNIAGVSRDRPLLDLVIRALHGEATGHQVAEAMAKAIRTQQQRMRRAFNAHGGDIGELADYGVTHRHDAGQLRAAGFKSWSDAIRPLLAWDRIEDAATGKPFAAAAGQVPPASNTDRFLQSVYDTITTRGWDDRDPGMMVGGKALYNQRAEHRVLHFSSGSAWLNYNAQFGVSDPLSAMMDGLYGLANDVAQMRVLGPSPRAGLEFAAQVAEKRAQLGGDAKLIERVRVQSARAKAMMAHQDGSASVAESLGWARFFSGTRAVLSSIQLGSAILSSVTDSATIMGAAQAVGMSGRNVLSRSVKLMASHATRETAARMGYVASTLADAGGGSARYAGQIFGTGLTQRMAGFTLRATGLTFVTDMRRVAFQMEFSGYMAENAARAFDQVDAPLRAMLEARGITSADWDMLRDPATRFRAPNGADFISPFHWLETQTAVPRVEAEGLAMRLQMAIQEQVELAIPSSSLEGRAFLQGTAAPGSVAGELLRSSTSYKSFTMSLMLGQYRRFAALPTPWDKTKYAAKMSVMLLMTGALAIQLKELAKGNDPRPMNTLKFWIAAQFQGGGLGIFGDFFQAETSRVGGGIAETIAGPVVGAAGDVLGPIASNVQAAAGGQATHLGRDVAGLVRRNTPFFSSAWPVRAAYSRIVADELQAFLDPEAEAIFRRRVKKQARDYGTQPYLPTRGAPQSGRLPDLSNILGAKK